MNNVDYAEKVFNEHGDFIRLVIRFFVKNESEGEDLFQDFFLSLISAPLPQEVKNVRAYLYQMISYKIKDSLISIKRYRRRERRYAQCHKSFIEDRPEDTVIITEEIEKMFDLIQSRLTLNEASAVMLRYKDNKTTGEVAQKMGIKRRSVSRYVAIGLKKLRAALSVSKRGNHDYSQF